MANTATTNYISDLTAKEKEYLCDFIPGEVVKHYFEQYPQDFQKLRKGGFRARALSEAQALSIAKSGINTPFISYLINQAAKKWLDEIQTSIEDFESQGLEPEQALAMTLVDSVFYFNIDLYCKLSKTDLDPSSRKTLRDDMELIDFIRDNSDSQDEFEKKEEQPKEPSESKKTEKDQKQREREEKRLEQKIQAQQEKKFKQKIEELEKETKGLKEQLSNKVEEIKALKTPPKTMVIDDEEFLEKYNDTSTYLLTKIDQNSKENEAFFSLCSVLKDENGTIWLHRHADLDSNGQLIQFNSMSNLPPTFGNRERIYYMNGPSQDSSYGIWFWTAKEHYSDPARDYIESQYEQEFEAIEVKIIPKVKSLEALIKALKKGIKFDVHNARILFAYPAAKNRLIGVICSQNEVEAVKDQVVLSDELQEIPVYEINRDQLLTTKDGLTFYNEIFLGLPTSLYPLKSPLEIVKKVVSNSISWPFYKARGKYRSQYTSFREMLELIPIEDIMAEIRKECRCSREAAQALLDDFLSSASKFIEGKSIEDDFLFSLVSANTKLQDQIKSLIHQDWQQENQALIEEKQKDIAQVEKQLAKASKDLDKAKEELKEVQEEEDKILASIADKEKLAQDVEELVSKRIQNAQEHAAEFIANMAFLPSAPVQKPDQEISEEPDLEPPVSLASIDIEKEENEEPAKSPYQIVSLPQTKNLEVYDSWTDVVQVLEMELKEAGVKAEYCSGLATYLCACFILKEPVFLVGPNALAIVKAISVSLSNHQYGWLNCEQEFHSDILQEFGAEKEKVVVLNNLLLSGWISRLPEIVSNKELFFIAIHPYAEDIQVEPKSLYSYILPLFTDFFVDEVPLENYIGGFFSSRFKKAQKAAEVKGKVDLSFLSQAKVGLLVRSKIRNLIKQMRIINPSTHTEEEFLFAILPIAYAALSTDELTELLSHTSIDRFLSQGTKADLQMILGEF